MLCFVAQRASKRTNYQSSSCSFVSFVVKSFLHIKADRCSGRHALARYGRLPQDNSRLVCSIAVITVADDTHLAQREAAFNQRDICIC